MVDEQTARQAVEDALSSCPPPVTPDDEFIVWKVEEHSRAWVVHFATRRWVATRDWRDQAIGSCPFVVEKTTGELHLYGSAPDEYAKFRAWLDEESGLDTN